MAKPISLNPIEGAENKPAVKTTPQSTPQFSSKAIRARLLSAGTGGGIALAFINMLADYDIIVGDGTTDFALLASFILFGYMHKDRPTDTGGDR